MPISYSLSMLLGPPHNDVLELSFRLDIVVGVVFGASERQCRISKADINLATNLILAPPSPCASSSTTLRRSTLPATPLCCHACGAGKASPLPPPAALWEPASGNGAARDKGARPPLISLFESTSLRHDPSARAQHRCREKLMFNCPLHFHRAAPPCARTFATST